MDKIIDGKIVAKKIKDGLKEKVEKCEKKPALVVIIVGDNQASRTYVNHKKKDCEYVGFRSIEYALPADTTQQKLLELIGELNADPEINGILCQLPLPGHINEKKIIEAIDPKKDVDCFHPFNIGLLTSGSPGFMPCTPSGIMELLEYYDIDIQGRECVVVGRSNIVGKPMALMLLSKNGTVTICHSKTKDLPSVCKRADILVAAIGRAKMINSDYVKKGAVVIDVGMNRDENGKLCGDVDYDDVIEIVSMITPVPGGVGPMTRAVLMQNTYKAYQDA
jgi:methylenetetrahydrofolate dehydrogenase (NADP+)/methenyltetrahydrofolate cyclohydrolase